MVLFSDREGCGTRESRSMPTSYCLAEGIEGHLSKNTSRGSSTLDYHRRTKKELSNQFFFQFMFQITIQYFYELYMYKLSHYRVHLTCSMRYMKYVVSFSFHFLFTPDYYIVFVTAIGKSSIERLHKVQRCRYSVLRSDDHVLWIHLLNIFNEFCTRLEIHTCLLCRCTSVFYFNAFLSVSDEA